MGVTDIRSAICEVKMLLLHDMQFSFLISFFLKSRIVLSSFSISHDIGIFEEYGVSL